MERFLEFCSSMERFLEFCSSMEKFLEFCSFMDMFLKFCFSMERFLEFNLINVYYKTNVAFLMSQTKIVEATLFTVTKNLFLAIHFVECLLDAMFCWVRQTALPRWLPCFVGLGKQSCQDGCHVFWVR